MPDRCKFASCPADSQGANTKKSRDAGSASVFRARDVVDDGGGCCDSTVWSQSSRGNHDRRSGLYLVLSPVSQLHGCFLASRPYHRCPFRVPANRPRYPQGYCTEGTSFCCTRPSGALAGREPGTTCVFDAAAGEETTLWGCEEDMSLPGRRTSVCCAGFLCESPFVVTCVLAAGSEQADAGRVGDRVEDAVSGLAGAGGARIGSRMWCCRWRSCELGWARWVRGQLDLVTMTTKGASVRILRSLSKGQAEVEGVLVGWISSQ